MEKVTTFIFYLLIINVKILAFTKLSFGCLQSVMKTFENNSEIVKCPYVDTLNYNTTVKWFLVNYNKYVKTGDVKKSFHEFKNTDRVYSVGHSLWINNITKNDSGIYACNVHNSTYYFTSSVMLDVYKKETINSVIGTNYELLCINTKNFINTFNCSYEVNWFKDREKINNNFKYKKSKEKLLIRNISKSDEGVYLCSITTDTRCNPKNLALKRYYHNNVIKKRFKDDINLTVNFLNSTIALGKNFLMECIGESKNIQRVYGSSIFWLINGVNVLNYDRSKNIYLGREMYVGNSYKIALIIKEVKRKYLSANFTCNLRNLEYNYLTKKIKYVNLKTLYKNEI